MATKAQQGSTLANFLADRWEQGSRKTADLAEALPDKKLEWQPVEGGRTYGGVLRHVAFWNQYVADRLNGKPGNETANELAIAEYPTKERVLEALARTSREVAAALRKQPSGAVDKIELAVTFIEHNSEHYGQLAVYARLMGVVPPASRG